MADNNNIGSDFWCVDDLTPGMRIVSGRLALSHAVARRLITPSAGLFYDENYGLDVRSWVGRANVGQTSARMVEDEAYKDERTLAASGDVTFISPSDAGADKQADSLEINLSITDADGPFELTLAIDEVSVEIVDKP